MSISERRALPRRRVLQMAVAMGAAGGLARAGRASADAGDVVYASSYGFDPADATDALQQALDSAARTVVIDDVGAEWLTRPLAVRRNDVTIVVESGVTVRAKPGGFPNLGDQLLNITGRSNVTLIGYGATLMMNKSEYTDGGQWRHVLNIESCTGIRVEGLTLAQAGGDGIYIGRVQSSGYATSTTDMLIRNVRCDGNLRNGLSVISADNLVVEGCAFDNTAGNSPQAGIDFEPNLADEQLTDIVIRDCTLDNNAGGGMKFVLRQLADTSPPISILVERIRIGPEAGDTSGIAYYGPTHGDPGGLVEVRDCLIQTAPYSSSLGVITKEAGGAALVFTRTVVLNWGNQAGHYQPINLLGLTIPEFGGVTWNDFLMITDQETPFLSPHLSSPDKTVVRSIHGNMTVVDPYGVEMDLGPLTDDITLQVRALTAVPATTVGVRALRGSVRRGAPITLLFTRESGDLAAPLAVRYSLSGSAVDRVDLDGGAEMVVIPPGASTARATVGTRRGLGGPRTATFAVEPTVSYAIGASSSASVTLAD